MIVDLHQDIGTAMGDPEFKTYRQTSLEQVRETSIKIVGATTYWRTPPGEPRCLDENVPAQYWKLMRAEEKFILSRSDLPDSPDSPLRLLLIQEGFAVPEPASFIEAFGKIEALYRAGVRVLQPVYFGYQGHQEHEQGEGRPSSIGTSSFDNPAVSELIGLTELGHAVCERWLEMGGILDASHTSRATLRNLIKLCRVYARPLLISHTGTQELSPGNQRCLWYSELLQLSEGLGEIGFLVGVALSRSLLLAGKAKATPHSWYEAVKRIAFWVGWEHVALGSDLGGAVSGLPDGIGSCGDLPLVLEVAQGEMSEENFEKLSYRNALEFLRAALPGK